MLTSREELDAELGEAARAWLDAALAEAADDAARPQTAAEDATHSEAAAGDAARSGAAADASRAAASPYASPSWELRYAAARPPLRSAARRLRTLAPARRGPRPARLRQTLRPGHRGRTPRRPADPAPPRPRRHRPPLVEDALRANDTRLVAAAVGPYAAEHLAPHAWRHAVLKCLFTEVPVAAVARLADRARGDTELARMLTDFAAERTAAGRPVPEDLRTALALTAPVSHPAPPTAAPAPHGGVLMRIFDPHIHMTSRTTDDYRAMYDAGVRALVEPSFWLGQPRTSPASFFDYFDALLGWEPFRASQYGIAHHCTLALNPKEANDPRCTPVLEALPRYLVKDSVVAVGEIGYDSMTPAEDHALAAQLQLAADHELPALVHTPHRDKLEASTAPSTSSANRTSRRSTSCSTTSTRPPCATPSTAAAGPGSPSIRTPRWTRTAWSPSCGTTARRGSSSTRPPTGAGATPSRPARSPTPC